MRRAMADSALSDKAARRKRSIAEHNVHSPSMLGGPGLMPQCQRLPGCGACRMQQNAENKIGAREGTASSGDSAILNKTDYMYDTMYVCMHACMYVCMHVCMHV